VEPRRPRLLRIAAAAVPLSLVLVSAAGSAPAATTIDSATAPQLLAITQSAIRAAHSGTSYESKLVGVGITSVLTNSQATSGEQFTTSGKAKSDVRVISGALYFNFNAAQIASTFGLTNSRWAYKWISVPNSNPLFLTMAPGLQYAALTATLAPTGKLNRTGYVRVRTAITIGVVGGVNAGLGLTSGRQVLYISTRAPYLPVEVDATGTLHGRAVKIAITFANWGAKFRIPVPATPTLINRTNL